MANVKLSHVYKVYENGHKAVNDFNIDIEDKEFIVFVGPSGCGKSTTLRMIAGLEEITAGDLFIGDTLVNDIEPKDRDIAMVFQNYALYPHMTVYDNMAFGLKNKHMPNNEIQKRVLEAAKILDIEDYLDRKPKAMSGGQRQRVALGRAIVRNPKVFLLDEPLSNLDAKLRAQMRTEITKLHKKLQTTFIYVTHDQVEAMTMGTRIVVMKLGYVQQIDTPINLYEKPGNKFVAGFIGTPQMNFFDVKLLRDGSKVTISFTDGKKFDVDFELLSKVDDKYLHGDKEVILGVRPEHLSVTTKNTGISAKVNVVEQLGNESILYGQLGVDDDIDLKAPNQVTVKIPSGTTYELGDIVNIAIKPEKIHLFDKETEVTLMKDIPEYNVCGASLSKGKVNVLGKTIALPELMIKAIGNHEDFDILIPPYACIDDGKDFELEVHKVEKIGDKKLVALVNGNRYLFLETQKDVAVGDKFSFSLRNETLTIVKDGETLLAPISSTESLLGRFVKEKVKANFVKDGKNLVEATGDEPEGTKIITKSRMKFYYEINGVKVDSPMEKVVKITSIEGPKCYSKQYRYVIDRKLIKLVDETEFGIPAHVDEILDYGDVRYAKLAIGDQSILAEVNKDFKETNVKVAFDGNDVEVFQIEIDMRIC